MVRPEPKKEGVAYGGGELDRGKRRNEEEVWKEEEEVEEVEEEKKKSLEGAEKTQ